MMPSLDRNPISTAVGLFLISCAEFLGSTQYLQAKEYIGQFVYPLFLFYRHTILLCFPIMLIACSTLIIKYDGRIYTQMRIYAFQGLLLGTTMLICLSGLSLIFFDITVMDSVIFRTQRYLLIRVVDRSIGELENADVTFFNVHQCDSLGIQCISAGTFRSSNQTDQVNIFIDQSTNTLRLNINGEIHKIAG